MALNSLESARVRLARYYLSQLRIADTMYEKGRQSAEGGLSVFDRDWLHIKEFQAWTASHAEEDEAAASLSRDYAVRGVNVLGLRLPPRQHIEWLEVALKVAVAQHDTVSEMWCLYYIANANKRQGDYKAAIDFCNVSLALARMMDEELCVGLNIYLKGEAERMFGNLDEARSLFEECLEIFQRLGYEAEVAMTYGGLGLIAWHAGDWTGARDYQARHLAIATDLGKDTQICDALLDLSLATWVLGDRPAAVEYLDRAIGLCRGIGYQRVLASALNTLGQYLQEEGRLDEARVRYEEAIAIARENGFLSVASFQLSLGDLLNLTGQHAEALAQIEESTQLIREHGLRRTLGEGLVEKARAHAALGQMAQADEALRESADIACELDNRVLKAHVIIEAIEILVATGKAGPGAEWTGLLLGMDDLAVGERNYLNQLIARMEASLGSVGLTLAMKRGEAITLDDVIRLILDEWNTAGGGKLAVGRWQLATGD